MRFLEIVIPFMIAGLGTCYAGIILDHVQFKPVFDEVDEIFLLLPALLGLKGNLQMTLASRLSTHSHLGHLQTKEDILSLTSANLSLNQFLSIVISFAASLLVTVIHLFTSEAGFDFRHPMLITATALLTSSVTSFLLDIVMVMVVQVSAQFGINPDNVATPTAASLGDMTALTLCYFCATSFYNLRDSHLFYWFTGIVLVFYLILLPIWMNVSQSNVHTSDVIKRSSYWYPLLSAMLISSVSGIILKGSVQKSADIALFTPVICGVGGNLVAVQASRTSSLLHQNQPMGQLPEGETVCFNPFNLLTSSKLGYDITRLLIIIVAPAQALFYFFIIYVNPQTSYPSIPFLLLYMLGSLIHVIVLIYLSYTFTYLLWTHMVDPDNSTIPYLTSISDVLGACIVVIICVFVSTPNRVKPFDLRLLKKYRL